jgi:hypothetical protein
MSDFGTGSGIQSDEKNIETSELLAILSRKAEKADVSDLQERLMLIEAKLTAVANAVGDFA